MALVKNDVKDALKSTLDSALSVTDPDDRETAINTWCNSVAGVIVDAIEDGINDTTVNFTLTAPSGAVTGTITLTAQVS